MQIKSYQKVLNPAPFCHEVLTYAASRGVLKRSWIKHILISLVLALVLLIPKKTFAESTSFGISPPVIYINATASAEIKTSVSVKNFAEKSTVLSMSLQPFSPGNETGGIMMQKDSVDKTILNSTYITEGNKRVQNITLGPNQKKDLTINIDFHEPIKQSDYYFAIVFTPNTSYQENTAFQNTSLSTISISLPVILSAGEKQVKGSIEEFSVPFFQEEGPVGFTVRLRNNGSNVIYPDGYILIENVFGQTIGKIDLVSVAILKDSVRIIPDVKSAQKTASEEKAFWDEKFILGPYKATLYVRFSKQASYIYRSARFIGFPTSLALGLSLGVIMLIIVLNRLKMQHKKDTD